MKTGRLKKPPFPCSDGLIPTLGLPPKSATGKNR